MEKYAESIIETVHAAQQFANALKYAIDKGYITIDGARSICLVVADILEEDQKS